MADQPVKVHRDISIVESEHTGIQPETPEICAVSVDDSSAGTV